MVRILFIDDHPIIHKGLKQILESTSNIAVTGEASSGQQAIKDIRQNVFDLVLLIIALSGVNNIELLKQIKSIKPDLPVLILSVSSGEQYYERFLRAGASGYLTKQSAANELIDAVRTVSQGHKYISQSLVEQLTDFPLDEPESLIKTLSDRELEVMVAIASGKRIKRIAEEMSLSIKTVSTYHARLFLKLKLKSDAGLIRYAIEHGVVSDSIAVRQNPVLAELSIKTASVLATIKEMWHVRKDVILILVVASVIAYVFLSFLATALLFRFHVLITV